MVTGGRIDSPIVSAHPPATTQRFAIGESTPLSREEAPLQPVPTFPGVHVAKSVSRLEEQVRTLQLDLTQERLRSTGRAKAQAIASGNQTPLPPQVVEMFEKQMENSNAMMREAREESRVQIETLKEFVSAKAEQTPPAAAKRKSSVLQVKPEINWPELGDDGPGGKEIEVFYERFEEVGSICNDGDGMNANGSQDESG